MRARHPAPRPALRRALLPLLAVAHPAAAVPLCTQPALAALDVDGVTIVSAAHAAAGGQAGPACTVFGTLNTGPDSPGSAGFQLRLPDSWNRKFIFFGVGGFAGEDVAPSANETDVAEALARGYATIITDTGHQGTSTDASWALIRPGLPATAKITDYLYRATHEVTVAGKTLVQRYYGQPIRTAYFDGCSNGGHQAMTEAADYPADYNGIIAGAPFFDPHAMLGGLHFYLADLASPAAFLPPAKLPAINAAVLKSCDAADGAADGIIQNPAACAFDPATLICHGPETDACLTPPQAATLNAYLSETRDAAGAYVYAGSSIAALAGAAVWNIGTTPSADTGAAEPWGNAGFSPAPLGWQFTDHVLKSLVAQDPSLPARHFPHGAGGALTAPDLALFDSRLAVTTDQRPAAGFALSPRAYSAFLAHGGKLLLYHGLADPAISPFSTMRLYEQMAAILPGHYEALRRSARLFLAPGMQHCSGPAFDTLTPLERWVEQGTPPAVIPTATGLPLCPFPQQAVRSSDGNWSCPQNQKMLSVGKNGQQAGL